MSFDHWSMDSSESTEEDNSVFSSSGYFSPQIKSNISSREFNVNLNEYEPLLDPSNRKQNAGEIDYPQLQDMYEKTRELIWFEDAIIYGQDTEALEDLEKEENRYEKEVIIFNTAFFVRADGIIMENLNDSFTKEIVCNEAKRFYSVQNLIECVHEQVYFNVAKALCLKKEDLERIEFLSRDKNNAIYEKVEWVKNWCDSSLPFAQRILAFGCVEGILFLSSFVVYLWASGPVRKEGGGRKHPLTFLRQSTEWIMRDETYHATFSFMIYKLLKNKLPRELVEKTFKSAVDLEIRFCKENLCFRDTEESKIASLSFLDVCQHIKYMANRFFSIIYPGERIYDVYSTNLDYVSDLVIDTNPLETTGANYKPGYVTSTPSDDFFNDLIVSD